MFERIYLFLTYLETWHILVGLGLLVGIIALLWSRTGIGLYITIFILAETFATAAHLRMTVPFVALLPMVLAVPLFVSISFRKNRLPLGALSWGWILVMIYFALRLNFGSIGLSASFWGLSYLAILLLGLAIGSLIATPTERIFTVKWLAYGSTLATIIGLSTIIIGGKTAYVQGRLAPFGIQANIWAPSSMVAFFNCLLYFQLTKGTVRKVPQMLMLAITVSAIFLTYSRGTIYSFIIAIPFYWMIGGVGRLKGLFVGLIVVILIGGGIKFGIKRGALETTEAKRLKTLWSASRATWELELARTYVAKSPILGIGFFEDPVMSTEAFIKHGDPHNSYLLVWIEQGTVGLMAVITLMFLNFIAIRRILKTWPEYSPENIIGKHSLLVMVALVLNGGATPHTWSHHTMQAVGFAIVTGVLSSLAAVSRFSPPEYEYAEGDLINGELMEYQQIYG